MKHTSLDFAEQVPQVLLHTNHPGHCAGALLGLAHGVAIKEAASRGVEHMYMVAVNDDLLLSVFEWETQL